MFVFMVVNYFILKFKGKRKGNLKLKYKCFFFNQLCTPQSCAINPNIDHEKEDLARRRMLMQERKLQERQFKEEARQKESQKIMMLIDDEERIKRQEKEKKKQEEEEKEEEKRRVEPLP
jgi:hypothetical protein